MNKLPKEKRAQILNLLVEGMSLRAITRITGVSINTVTKLLVDAGRACIEFHNDTVRVVEAKKIQADELWSFVYAKAKNVPENKEGEAGDVWTWVAIDADSKLVISWLVGTRDAESASLFMNDIRARVSTPRPQITTDGHYTYFNAVDQAFGNDVDYAQLVKVYSNENMIKEGKYSPVKFISARTEVLVGSPSKKDISTSYVERQNLTMRMHMRRFTRLTNAFSKKIENHCYAVALHFVYYNFCKIHKSLRVTPAIEAGIAKDIMELTDIVDLIEKKQPTATGG